MASTENFEATRPVDAAKESESNSFGAYTLERTAPGQWTQDIQQKTVDLVDSGVLPSLDLLAMSSDFRTGTEVGAKDLRDAGISCKRDVDSDGRESTTAEYPNGVKVTVTEGTTITREDGRKIEIGPSSMVELPPGAKEQPKGSGIYVDRAGKQLAKVNEDGSVTVDTGEGFFTQYPDGITKETAIRSRDGKTWTVIDTKTPLGGMKPSK
ncbi:MAG TPA: hypothetical protein V6D08_01185 [Candidatus Obscuribacterales bacterium]